jgi:glycosyltransferase involved in cell wall biosynthesis
MNLGGAERQLLILCNQLKEEVAIEIISLDANGPLLEKYQRDFPNISLIDSNKYSKFGVVTRIRNLIRKKRPDVVITWLYKADILGGIATKLVGKIPVIWSARNSEIPKFNFAKKWILLLLSKKVPTAIVANGNPAIDFHKSIGYPFGKILKIQNFLAPWTASVTSSSTLLSGFDSSKKIRVGLAARQVSGKGILETISAVEKSSFDIDLQLIGQKTSESLGWRSSGKYRNQEAREINDDIELSNWFKTLDIYLMSSSQWESQPNSLLEAIAIGCPVLVSDKIKLDFDLPSEFTFKFSDELSLDKALNTLTAVDTDRLNRLTKNLQDLVLSEFLREKIISQWLDLIRSYVSHSDK